MPDAAGGYRLYTDLAGWWALISPPGEYAAQARQLVQVLGAAPRPVREVLDLGSGGGHVAAHLTGRFALTLVDVAEPMLAASRRLLPGCPHHLGDMRSVRLGRRFDAVLVLDAAGYLTSEGELRQVIGTAFAHCRPGGIAVFAPDHTAETFQPGGGGGGGSDDSGRRASFRVWSWDPDPGDDWVQADYEFRLHDTGGQVQVVRESHRLGAFSRGTWLRLISDAGFLAIPGPDRLPGAGVQDCGGQVSCNLFIGHRPLA